MTSRKLAFLVAALTTGLSAPLTVSAQDMKGHADMAMPMAATMTHGVVRKIDKDNGKITIKHGDIKNLDMPGMTMVFDVKDKALLAPFKAGDKVDFVVIDNNGELLITVLQPGK